MTEDTPTPETDVTAAPSSKASPPSRLMQFPVTFGLIGFTIAVYIMQWVTKLALGDDLVLALGAKINEAISAGQIWRFITPIFVHVSPLHILVNMYSLYALGPVNERFLGRSRMLSMYFLSGVSGVIFSLAFSPYPSVGASGAIFGLLGSLGAFLYLHRKSFGEAAKHQLRNIVVVALLNLGLGLMPQIDNWGHLGGLLAGATLSWIVGPKYELVWSAEDRPSVIDKRPWRRVWPWILLILFLMALLAYAAIMSPFAGRG